MATVTKSITITPSSANSKIIKNDGSTRAAEYTRYGVDLSPYESLAIKIATGVDQARIVGIDISVEARGLEQTVSLRHSLTSQPYYTYNNQTSSMYERFTVNIREDGIANYDYIVISSNSTSYPNYVRLPNAITVYLAGDDTPPTIQLISPVNESIYIHTQNLFTWSSVSQSVLDVVENRWYYSEDGESWKGDHYTGTNQSVTIRKGYLPAGTVFWRVGAKTYFSDYAYSDIATINVIVPDTPPTSEPKSPVGGEEIPNTSSFSITWKTSSPVGVQASEGKCQCSYDDNDWTNPIYERSATLGSGGYMHCRVPAYIFHGGTVYWRCCAKTAYSDWGEWAYESFTAVEATPTVSNLKPNGVYQNKAKPITISWVGTSAEYATITNSEIEYDLSDGQGWRSLVTITGADTTYIVPANTFPAIAYTDLPQKTGGIRIRVRSKNRNDIFSAWAEASFATVDELTSATPASPISGSSKNEKNAILFQWYTSNVLRSESTGADLQYRYADGTWQTLGHVDGNVKTFTAEPDTFIGAVVYWRVRAYNQDGVASDWSSEAYFSTVDKPQISTALTPSSTIEDADEPITFTWSTSSQSGEASRGADLQYSRDNATWINFGPSVESGPQIPGNVHEYEAPGHTIPPGSIFWRVRSYNRNMVAGDWSTAVSFVARAAPTVQDIQATAKPWATVIWQADDQQTYEIFVDGESLGSYFGTEKQFSLPGYLQDGVHTVGVRVMGSFSLWSQINETQVTIANTQAAALTLTTETNIDTALSWEGGDGDFFIYRDGLMIAHTDEHSFTDRVALGTHEYQVIERLASGDYNASETVTQTPAVPYQHIAALAGGDWIGIPHTLKSQSEPSYQESQETAFNYLSGNDYPTASIGSHRTDVGQYSAVFLYTEEEENRAFLALRGKPVILKTADDEVMIGVLNAWERRPKSTQEKKLYTAYTFSLQRIGWEDFIDDTA